MVATGSSSAHRKLSGFGQSRTAPCHRSAYRSRSSRYEISRCGDAVPVVVRHQRPLRVGLLRRQRMVGAEQPRRTPCRTSIGWRAGPRSAPSGPRSTFWTGRRLARSQDHAAVGQHHPLQLEWQAALKVSGQQLGGHRCPHVVCDEHHRARRRLGDHGLPRCRPARAGCSGAAGVCPTARIRGSPASATPARPGAGTTMPVVI